MTKEQFRKLQEIYSLFRDADKLVVPELNLDSYTQDDVVKAEKAFTDYYHSVDEIRRLVGLLIDEVEVQDN